MTSKRKHNRDGGGVEGPPPKRQENSTDRPARNSPLKYSNGNQRGSHTGGGNEDRGHDGGRGGSRGQGQGRGYGRGRGRGGGHAHIAPNQTFVGSAMNTPSRQVSFQPPNHATQSNPFQPQQMQVAPVTNAPSNAHYVSSFE